MSWASEAIVSEEIICIGFTCPVCRKRVYVLRSCDPVPSRAELFQSTCNCGFMRNVRLDELQSLEVWRELTA